MMTNDPRHWTLTPHARRRLEERGLAPSDLVALIRRPDVVKPAGDGLSRYSSAAMQAVVNESDRIVVTVGPASDDARHWLTEGPAVQFSHGPDDLTNLDDLLAEYETADDALEALERDPDSCSPRRGIRQRGAGPVVVSNVLDGVHESLWPRVLELAEGDISRIVKLGPGRVEVHPPRERRTG